MANRKKQLVPLLILVAMAILNIVVIFITNNSSIFLRPANRLNFHLPRQSFFKDKVNTRDQTTPSTINKTMQNSSIPVTTKLAGNISMNGSISHLLASVLSANLKKESEIAKQRQCQPSFNPDDIKTSFKFFIYDLPPYFNYDITDGISNTQFHRFCYDLEYCGMGEELLRFSNRRASSQGPETRFSNRRASSQWRQYDANEGHEFSNTYEISIRNTHQFSLEVIMHFKLLHSPYRTLDPKIADIFYIPAYSALKCLTEHNKTDVATFTEKLYEHLRNNETHYYTSGKPHFSTLGKIQKEQSSIHCPLLRHPDAENITYFGIERTSKPAFHHFSYDHGHSVIVAPYPSYVHFTHTEYVPSLHEHQGKQSVSNLANTTFILDVPGISERNVFLFYAGSTHRKNTLRKFLIDQFAIKTNDSYQEYFSKAESLIDDKQFNNKFNQLMLLTMSNEKKHRTTTIPWMRRSVFCLQPPGDSPTRKSFYDSILSGCTPVLFTSRYPTRYPFQNWLQYDQFTITLDATLVTQHGKNVSTLLHAVPGDTVERLHNNVRRVAKWFQYSIPNGQVQTDDDAVTLLLKEVQYLYNLTGTQHGD